MNGDKVLALALRLFKRLPFKWQAIIISITVLFILIWLRGEAGIGPKTAGREDQKVTAKTDGPGKRLDDPNGDRAKVVKDLLEELKGL